MYKWIEFSDNNDIESRLGELRKKYNTPYKTYYFKKGFYKDKTCIFILNDVTTKTYGEVTQSKQFKGNLFFAPEQPISLSDYEVSKSQREWKIKVSLVAGSDLFIIPATLEPKKIVFDFDEEETKEESSTYSLATEYGRLAYSIFSDFESKKNVSLNDKRVFKLIMMGLSKSYSVPIDLINHLGIVSEQDLDPLLSACLGISPELLDKKKDS